MTAKDVILDRIRRTAGPDLPYDAIDRCYRQREPLDLHLFQDRLVDYGVQVYTCSPDELRLTIGAALSKAEKRSVLIPRGFPSAILPEGFRFDIDEGLSYEELDRAEGVLTGCALAVAETGTIFLRHTEAEGRRALTLIPDYHLCVVYAEQVVETVPEGIRLAALFGTVPVTTVSGPSATSDIEMTRVKGVHGPRTLNVILVA